MAVPSTSSPVTVSSPSSAQAMGMASTMSVSLGMRSPPPPLIGVLCIDVAKELSLLYGTRYKSYIAASYVKFLESAGARVVPIWIGQPVQYYEEMMSKLNGVLIPGGAVFINSEYGATQPELRNDCVASSQHIYEIASRQNDHGRYFPVWGTCLGYELLIINSAKGIDLRQKCRVMRHSMPLDFVEGFQQSHMFMHLSCEVKTLMEQEPFAYHYHSYCVTCDDLIQFNIADQWRVLATNKDESGLEFISLVEHTRYPFYGSQFHPERVCYEVLGSNDGCSHSAASIEAAAVLAKFFVDECRRNGNHFGSPSEEVRHLIFNFPVEFSGRHNAHWTQCYLFEDKPEYPSDNKSSQALPMPPATNNNLNSE